MKEFDTEEHYTYWGALQLSLWLIDFLSVKCEPDARILKKTESIINILKFLCRSKSDMLTFLYNKESVAFKLAPVKDKKSKLKAYMPIKLTWGRFSKRVIHENEVISPQEYKFRDTAKILADALERAADMISLLTGRDKNDILNSLIADKENLEIPETLSQPVPEQKYTGKTIFVMSETEYAEFEKIEKAKKETENKSKDLDIGFRVYKLDDVEENEPLPVLPPQPELKLETFEEYKEKAELGKEASELELAMQYSLNCEIAHRVSKITDEQFYHLLIKYCGKEICHRLLSEPEKEKES